MNDSTNMVADPTEEDQDSLFGSPPPSPTGGRSPSPALALPSVSSSGYGLSSSTQNVGTIALPGSHLFSEHTNDPLALSLSHITQCAPRPPAQTVYGSIQTTQSAASSSSASTPTWSRASSATPSIPPPKKKTGKIIKSKSKESTPRPPPPPIPLPDPSNPPPPNFLRNQSALLGVAGLVGGVHPANLSVGRLTRGTSSSNPIVVDDETDTPILGRGSKFRQPYLHSVDPALLPAPTNQDIVAMLIGQKDIFPVLESILRLIAAGAGPRPPPTPSAFQRPQQNDAPPPVKKRKLNRVPAGAADWDVPYPFPEGEGPDAYHSTWERQRGKQLISQLVGLIKSAARKAATKNYLQNVERWQKTLSNGPKVCGHYRPATAAYGQNGQKLSTPVVTPSSVEDTPSISGAVTSSTSPSLQIPYQPHPAWDPTPQPLGGQTSTPFDQLITSLLAASPQQSTPVPATPHPTGNTVHSGSNIIPPTPPPPTTSSVDQTAANQTPTTEGAIDPGLFESWMSIFHTFPVPAEGFPPPSLPAEQQGQGQQSEDPTGYDSIDFDIDFPANFDFGAAFGDIETLSTAVTAGGGSLIPAPTFVSAIPADTTIQAQDVPLGGDITLHSNGTSSTADVAPSNAARVENQSPDSMIDPALLEISACLPPLPVLNSVVDLNAHIADAPGPSAPRRASRPPSLHQVFAGPDEEGGIVRGEGMLRRALLNHRAHRVAFGRQGLGDESLGLVGPKDKGKGRATSPVRPTRSGQKATEHLQDLLTTKTSGARAPKNRAEVMKKAAEKKALLTSELERVKTQLWETTVEQGVLVHMARQYSNMG
ncbi:hypothetical protein BD779DRAFT_1495746 [Infundibulicybe gibba]|nr:hypothetical protein BD779DRAFT_1495746 [Infundibulicybe gibba]